jgi:hypothetical protein
MIRKNVVSGLPKGIADGLQIMIETALHEMGETKEVPPIVEKRLFRMQITTAKRASREDLLQILDLLG